MLRWFARSKAFVGLKVQRDAATRRKVPVGAYYVDDRDGLVGSLRTGDGAGVFRLSCLATSKADLRWALMGEDKAVGYKGIFLRGAHVLVDELDAKVSDWKTVEAVLLATEDWAKERRGGMKPAGGRPKKRRTDRHTANIAWLDRDKFPTMADALDSEHMKGWSQSAATRSIKLGGLGPRGAIPGRRPNHLRK
jgi:hypothetical protein